MHRMPADEAIEKEGESSKSTCPFPDGQRYLVRNAWPFSRSTADVSQQSP
jgi:hypothetical protein